MAGSHECNTETMVNKTYAVIKPEPPPPPEHNIIPTTDDRQWIDDAIHSAESATSTLNDANTILDTTSGYTPYIRKL